MPLRQIKSLLFLILLSVAPIGVAQEDSPSLTALRAAAERGQADAQYELGILYEFGYRFPDHTIAAYTWYSRAADQGNAAAAQRRDSLKGQMSPSDLQRAQTPSQAPAASSSR